LGNTTSQKSNSFGERPVHGAEVVGTILSSAAHDEGPFFAMAISAPTLRMRSRMSSRWHQICFCFLCVVASRLILIVIGLMSQRLAGIPFQASNLFMHWDAGWYTSIVNEGYHLSQYFTGPLMGQTNVNFFPLFPGLVWPLSFVLPAGLAGQIVANGCFLLGCIVMHQFAEERFDRTTANFSVLSACFFPGSFVFSASMTESLFFLLATWSFYQLWRNHWLFATIAAALLAITRPNGILIVFPLAIQWLTQRLKPDTQNASFKDLFYIFAVPLPLFAFMFYLFWHFDDAFAFIHSQKFWGANFDFRYLFRIEMNDVRQTMQKAVGLLMVLLFLVEAKRFTLAESTMVVLSFVFFSANSVGYYSLIRYLLPLYQIHQAIGILATNRVAGAPLIGSLAALNGLYMAFWVRDDAIFV
jgi:Gpi18-like mannosyltransferase